MRQLAIIGPTASGKSDLALDLAQEHNAFILSIDSLSIYQEIDIASAKPSPQELASVEHFGINALLPNVNATVFDFISEYRRIHAKATQEGKNIIIVGGSSFYLKSMLDGLSYIPPISDDTKIRVTEMLCDLPKAHQFLSQIDPSTMEKIAPNDPYRLEKMLHLYLETSTAPSQWFQEHPPEPIIQECPVLSIETQRSYLRERIALRTVKMLQHGLIDEISSLEQKYGRAANSMHAIGVIETLEFLDGKIDKSTLREKITTHTAQLAKRQQTFNTHQFLLFDKGDTAHLKKVATTILTHL